MTVSEQLARIEARLWCWAQRIDSEINKEDAPAHWERVQ